jgi:hypothetical protein
MPAVRYAGCTVCRLYGTPAVYYAGCTVCRLYGTPAVQYAGCTVHRLYSMPDESRLQSALIWHTLLYCTESDDTRCCDNTICPPEDGHVDARNMSRIVM